MLSDWERRQLVEIERELSSDRLLADELDRLSGHDRRRTGFWRRFYPAGYLGSAITYMLMSMAGRAAKGLAEAMVVVLTVWAAEQVRQTSRARSERRSAILAADD